MSIDLYLISKFEILIDFSNLIIMVTQTRFERPRTGAQFDEVHQRGQYELLGRCDVLFLQVSYD